MLVVQRVVKSPRPARHDNVACITMPRACFDRTVWLLLSCDGFITAW